MIVNSWDATIEILFKYIIKVVWIYCYFLYLVYEIDLLLNIYVGHVQYNWRYQRVIPTVFTEVF